VSRAIAQREALRLARYAYERVGKLTPEEWALWLAGEMLRDQQLEVTAERRRIRKAIRAEITKVEGVWDESARAARETKHFEREARLREDCARIVQGLDSALWCVRAPRKRGGGR